LTTDILDKFNSINKICFFDKGIVYNLAIIIGSKIKEKILSNKGKNELIYNYDKGIARIRLQDQYIHCDKRPACFSKKYGFKIWFRRGIVHRMNGPAIVLKEEWEDWLGNRNSIGKKTWVSNGKSLMDKNIPLYYGNEKFNCVDLSPEIIFNAMLIDREYGNFLKEKLRNEPRRWNS